MDTTATRIATGATEDGGQWPCPRCDTMMIEKVQQTRGGPLRWWCRFCMRSCPLDGTADGDE